MANRHAPNDPLHDQADKAFQARYERHSSAKLDALADVPVRRALKWAAGIILSVIGAAATVGVTAWANAMEQHASKIEGHGERLGRMETHKEDVDRRLQRIEDKLDSLLQLTKARP